MHEARDAGSSLGVVAHQMPARARTRTHVTFVSRCRACVVSFRCAGCRAQTSQQAKGAQGEAFRSASTVLLSSGRARIRCW